MADLTDKVIVITGGGRGIGAATARLLAGEGCQVVLAARTPGELEEMRHEIQEGGGRVLSVKTDVASEEDVIHLFAEAKREFGPVEILVNNAGILERMPVHEMDAETWDRVLGVNLRGVFLCAREAMRQMIPIKQGSIINISSVAGVAGIEKWSGSAAYCASKG
ncbi:MAG: SDR family NAD(P)-dependent oxidoreductase, partial [Planctomycetota bacterium]|nr:SDR family NAD(P)-dependent oxidoreductase [Planctomycetota bacterium]